MSPSQRVSPITGLIVTSATDTRLVLLTKKSKRFTEMKTFNRRSGTLPVRFCVLGRSKNFRFFANTYHLKVIQVNAPLNCPGTGIQRKGGGEGTIFIQYYTVQILFRPGPSRMRYELLFLVLASAICLEAKSGT